MAELSPEERQRIYLEEKARFEAQEQVKREKLEADGRVKQKQKEKQQNRTKIGCLALIVVCIVALFLEAKKEPPPPPSPAEVAKQAKAVKTNFAECRKNVEKAKNLEVLYDLKAKGASIQAFVGPNWFSMPIDAKEGFHETLQCFLMEGKGGAVTTLVYKHWRTGNVVAEANFAGRLKILN